MLVAARCQCATSLPTTFRHPAAFLSSAEFLVARTKNPRPRNTSRNSCSLCNRNLSVDQVSFRHRSVQRLARGLQSRRILLPHRTSSLPSFIQDGKGISSSFSTAAATCSETPLYGAQECSALLHGLRVHTVCAKDDGHSLTVYEIDREDGNLENEKSEEKSKTPRTPVLLLHGRTWSSVPVYHLVGGRSPSFPFPVVSESSKNLSLMEALYNTQHITPYAVDFRGFGGTPKDDSGFAEPDRCVLDVVSVLNWIHEQSERGESNVRPALLGWSQGALIAQLVAQRQTEALSKLVLYGSIYNPNITYSEFSPPVDNATKGHTDHDDFPLFEEGLAATRNEYDCAMEDFTVAAETSGMFPPVSARWFAEAALICDPIKVRWWNLHQLNECNPALVKVPTMVIAGDEDPFAPVLAQAELFTNLGRGVDRTWSIIANANHAVHLSNGRDQFVENVKNFLMPRAEELR